MRSNIDRELQERDSRPLPAGEQASDGNYLVANVNDRVGVDGDVEGAISPTEAAQLEKKKEEGEEEAPVTWASLPHRSQLIILTLARLSEPLVQTSLQVRRSAIDKTWLWKCANISPRIVIYVLPT